MQNLFRFNVLKIVYVLGSTTSWMYALFFSEFQLESWADFVDKGDKKNFLQFRNHHSHSVPKENDKPLEDND